MDAVQYQTNPRSRKPILRYAIPIAAVLIALGGWLTLRHFQFATPVNEFTYVRVQVAPLEITLHQTGELQSVESIDVNCPVEGQNTLQQIVEEGTFVHKGDVLAVIDSTDQRQKLQAALLELEKAEGDVKWSAEQKAIEEVKNATDLDAANSDLTLARIDLDEYSQGEYPAQLQELRNKLNISNIALKRKEEELAASRRLMQGGFLTLSEVQHAEMDALTARNEQEKAASDLDVLEKYKHVKDQSEKENKLSQAKSKVARVTEENASNLAQKLSDLSTKQKQQILRQAEADHAKEQFDSCTIKAPADGMVLYASSVNRGYFRDQPIQVGSKIMQEQMLISLPNIEKMKAVVKIQEAQVGRLKVEASHPIRATVQITGLANPLNGTLAKVGILPDSSQMWINPDAKNYPVEIALDETPKGMKPGASVEVTIYAGHIEKALAAPLATIYSSGPDHYVFVRDALHPRPVKVQLGQSNPTMVEIAAGLEPGMELVLLGAGQGRELLDLAGIKPPDPQNATPPTSQPAPAMADVLH